LRALARYSVTMNVKKAALTTATTLAFAGAAIFAGLTISDNAHAEGVASVEQAFTDADVEAAFDRGMKAGVEYETWFCDNPTALLVP